MHESNSSRHDEQSPNPDADFETRWWERLLDHWNASNNSVRHLMAGAGAFAFEVYQHSISCIFWDDQGFARLEPFSYSETPRFSAPIETWRAFVDRKFEAASGFVLGDIAYHGSVNRILPFIRGFDALADIGHLHGL